MPDVACWIPNNCCLPDPCKIKLEDFICAVRSLLPEGEIYNNTRQKLFDPLRPVGVVNIGCARIGCEQLIFGSCCKDDILCDEDPPAPQLAVVDSYAAVAYSFIEALCRMLAELDPCTSDRLRRAWAKRMGIISDDPCAPQWSDNIIKELVCILPTLKNKIWNWRELAKLAARFGADICMQSAGDFSDCGPLGWWTMARDRPADCPDPPVWPELPACPEEDYIHSAPWIRMEGPCQGLPDSLNLILCPGPIRYDVYCDLSKTNITLPHDPELYSAFKWLLPQILPQPVHWCVYECASECVEPPEAAVGCYHVGCEQMVVAVNPMGPDYCITNCADRHPPVVSFLPAETGTGRFRVGTQQVVAAVEMTHDNT